MAIQVPSEGPIPAKVMLVGEAPGAEEEARRRPFVGASGMELDRMLGDAGIARSECYVTNVCKQRPPNNDITAFIAKAKKARTNAHIERLGRWVLPPVYEGLEGLSKEIAMVKPNIIIGLGGTPLWALTGREGITKWRGSMLYASDSMAAVPAKFLPTYHPAAILRQYDWRAIAVQDLRRAARFKDGQPYPEANFNFILRPSYEQAISTLDSLLSRLRGGERVRISFDLETRAGHIACAGISWDGPNAICIPFMQAADDCSYWGEHEEANVTFLLYRLLTHSNALVVGQNLLYDCQYTYRHWHFVPQVVQDTMISQHSIFSDMPKGLAFLASMYCDRYVYWKDEGKNWAANMGESQLWGYNCQDCVYTDEVAQAEIATVKKLGLEKVHAAQQEMFWPVLQAMQRGVRIDTRRRSELILEVQDEITKREQFLLDVLGHPINPRSPVQMKALFYTDLQQPIQMTRAKKGVPGHATLDDEALQKLAIREPLLRPIISAISDIRTLGIFTGNFLAAALDTDGRMRCAYNIGGSASGKSAPKTYRLSSSENAFGCGTNLQNVPSEKSKSLGKAAARGSYMGDSETYQFPNIREIFIPDPGYTWIDGDLDRADLQVVVYESNDAMLKAALHLGADIHLMNAFVLNGKEPPPIEELVEGHSRYQDHRQPLKLAREFAKVFCHGTNYGGGARTMAAHTGRTVHEVDRAQQIWFGAHPGIKRWHDTVKATISKRRFIENRFGYRWYIFDRIDSVVPEAIAWVPQSTVSIVINKIWLNLYKNVPEAEVLLQVHDSLGMQVKHGLVAATKPNILKAAEIIIPYEDPLTIPFSLKQSAKSWGECE